MSFWISEFVCVNELHLRRLLNFKVKACYRPYISPTKGSRLEPNLSILLELDHTTHKRARKLKRTDAWYFFTFFISEKLSVQVQVRLAVYIV